MSGKVIHIKSKEEFDKYIKDENSQGSIVDFTASWCGPCKFIAPIFEKLAEQNQSFHFLKVDVDELAEVSEAYDVSAMPTFLKFVGGKKVGELVGADQNGLTNLVKT